MEDLNARCQEILAIAKAQGRVSVEDLAARFEVTPQTIRKDLKELSDHRLLSRVHGGARRRVVDEPEEHQLPQSEGSLTCPKELAISPI